MYCSHTSRTAGGMRVGAPVAASTSTSVVAAVDTIRVCAADDPLVRRRLIELLERLAARVSDAERRRALRAAAERIVATLENNAMIAADRTPLVDAAHAAVSA